MGCLYELLSLISLGAMPVVNSNAQKCVRHTQPCFLMSRAKCILRLTLHACEPPNLTTGEAIHTINLSCMRIHT